ncbi:MULTISPECIES: hypothetical protein [Actinomadura]|jgi:hypothetical protein|uniref:Uncharacterized protein n=2 Tax=Actinomadura TaxID=1988 RepID=A0A239NWA9_9ACTN|nr:MULTISPECIES: hypothetical protein [Actinomadura]QKG27211.1 hypothetical protein ACTIVE_8864 [Actinomadura verrucosospora]SNT58718.1 hypothetical protein SAMN05443665_105045 [Actinomadura meyerae]HEU5025505.1 hypothetical protein [Spirillospora sp.]
MRELTINDQSWNVDEDDTLVEGAERLESADPVEAASLSYGYARI